MSNKKFNSFDARDVLSVNGKDYEFYSDYLLIDNYISRKNQKVLNSFAGFRVPISNLKKYQDFRKK